MSLGDKILKILSEPVARYKGMSVNILGLPVNGYKKQSFYNAISKLKKEGYVLSENDRLKLSHAGRKYIRRKIGSMKTFSCCFPKEATKNLIVMYDIPQERRAEREWFRFHLRKFGYEMIQKSVWVGPSPLPAEFILYLKHIHLEKCIKTLKLAKTYEPGSFGLK
jgi:DNA-binding transcriptional regulator PaaX